MQSQRKVFGLIGYPLGHSYSKDHFTRKFKQEGLSDHDYLNFEIPAIGMVEEIIRDNVDLVGLNVTIPYKKDILSFLDDIDPVARKIGAVNTIKINRAAGRNRLSGYNTDVSGFVSSVSPWKLDSGMRALVFGSGGSSLAIKFALEQFGIDFLNVSRTGVEGFIPYEAVTGRIASEYLLWINCTPVGMFPKTGEKLPLPYECLTPGHCLYDLVYNPGITGFLEKGIEAGSRIMNGSAMLREQAEASWEIWNR